MELIKKCIDVVAKATDDERRVITFIGSTGSVDRDGEVLEPQGWELDAYRKNPVFLWMHNHSNPPVGRTVKVWKKEGQLKFDVEFPTEDIYPFGDTIYKLYKNNYLNAVSVAFLPLKWKDGDTEKGEPYRTYNKQELFELSGVTVPANQDALAVARDAGCITDGEFKFTKAVQDGESVDDETLSKMVANKDKMDAFLAKSTDDQVQKVISSANNVAPVFEIESQGEEHIWKQIEHMNEILTAIAKHLKLKDFVQDMSQADDQLSDGVAGDSNDQCADDECYLSEIFEEAYAMFRPAKKVEPSVGELLNIARNFRR